MSRRLRLSRRDFIALPMIFTLAPDEASPDSKGVTNEKAFKQIYFDTSKAGNKVEIESFELIWADDFKIQSVVEDTVKFKKAPATAKWFSPGHPDSKALHWCGPDDIPSPFQWTDLGLRMSLSTSSGQSCGACIQSVDNQGDGFSLTYGYWELRARFPSGGGVWPAFWLYSTNRYTDELAQRCEIDIVEAYGDTGKSQRQHHASVHLWKPPKHVDYGIRRSQHKSHITTFKNKNLFDGNWHTYGCEVNSKHIIYYCDRAEIVRLISFPEARTPKYILLNIGPKLDLFTGGGPFEMDVNYVNVYKYSDAH